MLYLDAHLSRLEADLEGAALASGTSLGAASARSDTDLATTGAKTSQTAFLTSKPKHLRIPLNNARWNEAEKQYQISDRSQLLVTASRVAAAVNGVLAESMSGQAAFSLNKLLGPVRHERHCNIPVAYANWPALSSVLGVCDARVVDENGDDVRLHFTNNEKIDKRRKAAQTVLESLYKMSWETRAAIVYQAAPNLTKSIMRVPFGVDGTTFDLSSSVVAKQFPLPTESLEALLQAAIGLEFAYDASTTAAFLDPAHKGMASTRWAGNVASSFSTLAGFLVPYRADGRTALLPKGLETFGAESWLAEPMRIPFAADDCDGSAALITSAFHHINDVFKEDPAAKTKYPWLWAAHRSLVHYDIGVSVLGANGAHADEADHTKSSIAGHAVALLVPKLHVLKALAKAEGGEKHALARLEAMYPAQTLLPIPLEEQKVFNAGWEAVVGSTMFNGLEPLAAEGTSPADSKLWTQDETERYARNEQADLEKMASARIAPSVGLVIKTLDATPGGVDHRFYSDFVEISLSTRSPLLTTPALQRAGVATSHLVLAQPDGKTAGVTPMQLVEQDYTAAPLWTLDTSAADVLLDAVAEVQENTLPRRAGSVELSAFQSAGLKDSLAAIDEIEKSLKSCPADGKVDIVALVSYSAMVHNPSGVELLRDLIAQSGASGEVDRVKIPGLATLANGEEAGLFVALNLCM